MVRLGGGGKNSSAGPALEFSGSSSRDITHIMCNLGNENAGEVCLAGPTKDLHWNFCPPVRGTIEKLGNNMLHKAKLNNKQSGKEL